MKALSSHIGERPVGSEGNRKATEMFREELSFLGWNTQAQEFDAIDWKEDGAELSVNGESFEVFVSPYSLGCSVKAPIAEAESLEHLENGDFKDKIIFLHGEIAKEQLMPKNFVFYNPDHHRKIVSLLENSGAKAIVCATGKNASLAGGIYPFPLIEDGDFDIPSVYMTEEEGLKFLQNIGKKATLISNSERIPAKAFNITGKIGESDKKRIVITAHIDSKKGSPGAIDNATGIVIQLLLAEWLKDYSGDKQIEIVALNGEDYYSVPGQMKYIETNKDSFDNILLNINIDGPGYKAGETAFSFFNIYEEMHEKALKVIREFSGIVEGPQWPQGDHSIFVQNGVPALAITSKWLLDNHDQDITHTEKDNISNVDFSQLVDVSLALNSFIRSI